MSTRAHAKRDGLGSLLGILVFIAGIALLGETFNLAYTIFTVPPKDALGLHGSKVIDYGLVGNSLTTILLRIALLLIMGIVGSLVSNRGVHLYAESRGHVHTSESKPSDEKS